MSFFFFLDSSYTTWKCIGPFCAYFSSSAAAVTEYHRIGNLETIELPLVQDSGLGRLKPDASLQWRLCCCITTQEKGNKHTQYRRTASRRTGRNWTSPFPRLPLPVIAKLAHSRGQSFHGLLTSPKPHSPHCHMVIQIQLVFWKESSNHSKFHFLPFFWWVNKAWYIGFHLCTLNLCMSLYLMNS